MIEYDTADNRPIEPPIYDDDTPPQFIVWHPRIGVKIFDDEEQANEYAEESGSIIYKAMEYSNVEEEKNNVSQDDTDWGEHEGKFPYDPNGKTTKESDEFLLNLFASMREDGTLTYSTEFMAYTMQFELFFQEVQLVYPEVSRRWVYRKLCGLRKKGMAKTRVEKSVNEKFTITPAQVRILKALQTEQDNTDGSSNGGLDRRQISDKADVPYTIPALNAILGPKFIDDTDGVEDRVGKRTLRGMGYVSAECDEDGRVTYFITRQGRIALKEYQEAKQAKMSKKNTRKEKVESE